MERGVLFGSLEHILERGLADSFPFGLISESLEIIFLFAQALEETLQYLRSLQIYAVYVGLNPEWDPLIQDMLGW